MINKLSRLICKRITFCSNNIVQIIFHVENCVSEKQLLYAPHALQPFECHVSGVGDRSAT